MNLLINESPKNEEIQQQQQQQQQKKKKKKEEDNNDTWINDRICIEHWINIQQLICICWTLYTYSVAELNVSGTGDYLVELINKYVSREVRSENQPLDPWRQFAEPRHNQQTIVIQVHIPKKIAHSQLRRINWRRLPSNVWQNRSWNCQHSCGGGSDSASKLNKTRHSSSFSFV